MLRQKDNQAQSITEYAVLIFIVSMVLIAMQVYMKRGIQGVIKTAADEIGNQQDAEEIDVNKGTKTDSDVTTVKSNNQTVNTLVGGSSVVNFDSASTSTGSSIYKSQKEK